MRWPMMIRWHRLISLSSILAALPIANRAHSHAVKSNERFSRFQPRNDMEEWCWRKRDEKNSTTTVTSRNRSHRHHKNQDKKREEEKTERILSPNLFTKFLWAINIISKAMMLEKRIKIRTWFIRSHFTRCSNQRVLDRYMHTVFFWWSTDDDDFFSLYFSFPWPENERNYVVLCERMRVREQMRAYTCMCVCMCLLRFTRACKTS